MPAIRWSPLSNSRRKRSNGTARLEFRFTVLKRDLHNVVLVAYERLYSNPMQDAQQLTAEHADIADEGQTVRIIDIGTQARDAPVWYAFRNAGLPNLTGGYGRLHRIDRRQRI